MVRISLVFAGAGTVVPGDGGITRGQTTWSVLRKSLLQRRVLTSFSWHYNKKAAVVLNLITIAAFFLLMNSRQAITKITIPTYGKKWTFGCMNPFWMTYKCVVKLYFKSLCSFLANKKTGGYSPIFLPDSRGLLFSLSCLGHQHLAPRVNILGPILTSYDIQARQRTTGHRSFQIISFSPPSLQAKKHLPIRYIWYHTQDFRFRTQRVVKSCF